MTGRQVFFDRVEPDILVTAEHLTADVAELALTLVIEDLLQHGRELATMSVMLARNWQPKITNKLLQSTVAYVGLAQLAIFHRALFSILALFTKTVATAAGEDRLLEDIVADWALEPSLVLRYHVRNGGRGRRRDASYAYVFCCFLHDFFCPLV
jgi:hypothetical protein